MASPLFVKRSALIESFFADKPLEEDWETLGFYLTESMSSFIDD